MTMFATANVVIATSGSAGPTGSQGPQGIQGPAGADAVVPGGIAFLTSSQFAPDGGTITITGAATISGNLTINSGDRLYLDGPSGNTRYISWNGASIGFNGPISAGTQAVNAGAIYPGATSQLSIRGRVADTSGSTAVRIGNVSALTSGTAKILSVFSDDFITERVSISADGTASLQKIRISGSPSDLYSDGVYALRSAGSARFDASILAGDVNCNGYSVSNVGGSGMGFLAGVTNISGAMAFIFRNFSALTGADRQIAAFYSDNTITKKSFIDSSGSYVVGPTQITSGSVVVGTNQLQTVGLQANNANADNVRHTSAGAFGVTTAGVPVKTRGNMTSSGGSVAMMVGNVSALTASGDKIVSFYNDQWVTEKAYVNNSGGFYAKSDIEVSGSVSGLILSSPDGTRWRLTVNNSGVVSASSL